MTATKKEKVSFVAVLASIAIITNPISAITILGRGIFVYIYSLMLVAFLLKVSQRKKLFWNATLTSFTVFLSYCLLGLFWSVDPDPTRLLQILVIIIVLGSYGFNNAEQNLIKIGAVISLLITIYLVYVSSVGVQSDGRATIYFLGIERDQNYVSLLLLPGMAVLTKMIFETPKTILKVLATIIILLSLYTELRLGSRGGILSGLVLVGLSLLLYRKRSFSTIIIIIGVILIIYSILPQIMESLPEIVSNRLSRESVENDQLSGRVWIWQRITSMMFDDVNVFRLLFGYGTRSTILYIGMAAHNFILQYLFEGGFVCLVLLFMFIIRFIKSARIAKDYLSLIIFLSSFFMALSLSISGILEFWINIAVAFALMNPNQYKTSTLELQKQ